MASKQRLTEAELDRAVLRELMRSLDGSTTTPTIDIQRLLDHSEYRMEGENKMDALGDDDWRDIKANRNEQSSSPDNFVRLYDEQRRTMYHIDVRGAGRSSLGAQSHDTVASAYIPLSHEDHEEETLVPPDVKEVLDRLTLENGRFLPRGYQEWMARKLQSRFPVANDIPGYATLCECCHRVLAHSLVLYFKVLRLSNSDVSDEAKYIGPHYEVFDHYDNMKALHASQGSPCHLCSIIASLHPDEGDSEKRATERDALYCLKIRNSFGSLAALGLHVEGRLTEYTWIACHSSWEKESTLKFASTKHSNVIQLARTWLNRCLEEDKGACSMLNDHLPTRLIEITTMRGLVHAARLVLGKELAPDTQYLTLSHCWGGLDIAILEKSKLDDFRKDIPPSILSKTFQDALQVTSWLGYQYIWIDSLCIQQDSVTDWKHEAANMGAIYRHSSLTIAASGAKDGNGGLFFERSAFAFMGCPLAEIKGLRMYAECGGKRPTPLSSRAWAVQERLLSPRTLSFGFDKISWSCRRSEACEGPSADDVDLADESFPRLLDQNTPEDVVCDAWREVVRQYSSCMLTKWEDKWPAFQGLATEVANAQNWTIVHGLRQHRLAGDLLWLAKDSKLGTLERGEPSWSWLNVMGEVRLPFFPLLDEDLDAKIGLRESSASMCTGETTGDIMNGVLEVEACMVEFETSFPKDDWPWVDGTLTIKNPEFLPDDESDRLMHVKWCPDTIPFNDGDMWALQLTDGHSYRNNDRWRYEAQGLIVAAVHRRPGYYRRIGQYDASVEYHLQKGEFSAEDARAENLVTDDLYTRELGQDKSHEDAPHAEELDSGDLIPDEPVAHKMGIHGSGTDDFDTDDSDTDESTTEDLPCPWNREKKVIYLI